MRSNFLFYSIKIDTHTYLFPQVFSLNFPSIFLCFCSYNCDCVFFLLFISAVFSFVSFLGFLFNWWKANFWRENSFSSHKFSSEFNEVFFQRHIRWMGNNLISFLAQAYRRLLRKILRLRWRRKNNFPKISFFAIDLWLNFPPLTVFFLPRIFLFCSVSLNCNCIFLSLSLTHSFPTPLNLPFGILFDAFPQTPTTFFPLSITRVFLFFLHFPPFSDCNKGWIKPLRNSFALSLSLFTIYSVKHTHTHNKLLLQKKKKSFCGKWKN